METENQTFFRKMIAEEMSRQELEDRLVEYHGRIDELKSALAKYSDNEISWDEIIGGISNYLYAQFKNVYNISREDFFDLLVCYTGENPPKFIKQNKIDWEELKNRYIEESIGYGPIENRVFNFLEKQPEFA